MIAGLAECTEIINQDWLKKQNKKNTGERKLTANNLCITTDTSAKVVLLPHISFCIALTKIFLLQQTTELPVENAEQNCG